VAKFCYFLADGPARGQGRSGVHHEADNERSRQYLASHFACKMEKGCICAWHFHTAVEELIVIKGELKVEMFSVPPAILGPGGYAQVPSNEKHPNGCSAKNECVWFVRIDRVFDSKAVQLPY
jgi:quercetin dioxygenase-like cupin family protein